MSAQLRIERYEELAHLVAGLAGDEFGGTPACATEDPELFFPTSESDTARIGRAKAICAGCPVRRSCLEHALRTGDQGIWGGATTGERRAMRRIATQDTTEQDDEQGDDASEGVQAA